MEVKEFSKLGAQVYEETLDNGLRIYIAPLERNSISVSFTTLFGSKDINFVPYGKKEMYYLPPGVAHFLEHKMFERKEGKSVFEFFNETGTYNNAFTSKDKTQYIFEGPSDFDKNLSFLLDFVLKPSFTKKDVEKEKPIILEEARAAFDSPINMAYDVAMKNAFQENSYMFPIIGTYSSINAITKEDLMLCHKTFYTPSNMILVISGNVDPVKTIELIKKSFSFQKIKSFQIERETVEEPDAVTKKYEEIYMPVTHEVFYLAYKLNIKKMGIPLSKIKHYLNALFILKLGNLSKFNDVGLRNGDLLGQLGFDTLIVDDHLIFGIYGEVKDSLKTLSEIQNEFSDLSIDEKDLNLLKKSTLSNLVLINEQTNSINNKIVEDVCNYGEVGYDIYNTIESLNINEYELFVKNLDLENYTISVVKNKKKSWFFLYFMVN